MLQIYLPRRKWQAMQRFPMPLYKGSEPIQTTTCPQIVNAHHQSLKVVKIYDLTSQ